MNNEMAYLLGMIYGNGEINNAFGRTSISIEIPHKKLETEDFHNVKIYQPRRKTPSFSYGDIRRTLRFEF